MHPDAPSGLFLSLIETEVGLEFAGQFVESLLPTLSIDGLGDLETRNLLGDLFEGDETELILKLFSFSIHMKLR